MLPDQALQLTDERAGPTPCQFSVDAGLDRFQPQLRQPGDLRLGERLVREVLEGVPPPHGKALANHERSSVRVGRQERTSLGEQSFEPIGVHVGCVRAEGVPGCPGVDE